MTFEHLEGAVCAPRGFRAGAVSAGIYEPKRADLALIVSDGEAVCAGVLTTNLVHAWCVAHNREKLSAGRAHAIICNSGNANACNGFDGKRADRKFAAIAARRLGCSNAEHAVLTASTGVIGRPFPLERIECAAGMLVESLGRSPQHAADAAKAIMTTDHALKSAAVEFAISGKTARIGGIAKGSGMIAPNMATMLSFITSDVEISAPALQIALKKAVDASFNCLTVDGDTSTNDMVLVLANGCSGVNAEENLPLFTTALEEVCRELAKKIAADGEGATKLISVVLRNAPPGGKRLAKAIAESPLVKTACFGNDPNWGRILAAAGRSGVEFDPARLAIRLAGHEVFKNGEPTDFSPAQVSAAMNDRELKIELEFCDFPAGRLTVWTCDLSYDYVKINADYTT